MCNKRNSTKIELRNGRTIKIDVCDGYLICFNIRRLKEETDEEVKKAIGTLLEGVEEE